MVFLPGLIGVALAALPAIEESVTRLMPALVVGPAFESYSVVSIPVPVRPPEHSLYRLQAAAGKAWLDGAPLTPNEEGGFDLLNLNARRPSRVTLQGFVREAALVETPRVFVSQVEIGGRSARVWVRNSLENTVNVYVTISGAGAEQMEVSATIPPGTTQILTAGGRAGISDPPWRIVLEKQEEAMEGAYRFVKTVYRRTGQTVNSYVKP